MSLRIHNSFVLCIAIIIIAISAVVFADVYVPSLPAITAAFATTPQLVQLTLASYFLAFALSILCYGPLCDSLGRRCALLLGASIAFAGILICLLATDIHTLIVGRFCQGLGAGSFVVVGRSMLRDLFSGAALVKVVSYMSICIAIAPALAPTIGGYLEHDFGWHGAFYFMLAYTSLIIFLAVFVLPETVTADNKRHISFAGIFKTYQQLLCDRHFISHALLSATVFGTVIAYFAIAPFYLMHVLKVTPVTFGWYGLIIMTSGIVGRIAISNLISKFSAASLIVSGIIIMLVASVILLLGMQLAFNPIMILVGSMCLFIFGGASIMPMCMTNAVTPYGHMAGRASAMYSFTQAAMALLGTGIAKLCNPYSVYGLSAILLIASLFALGIVIYLRTHPKQLCKAVPGAKA